MNNYVTSMRASDGSIVKLECHNALHSTARLAKEYAKLGYPDRYVVLAEERQMLDADGHFKGDTEKGVFLSCILRPSIFPSQAALISSLATVAMVTALEEHTMNDIGIGWVSNVYCNGSLIGNASIEGKLDNFTSYEYIIVNFSVILDENNFPPRVTDLIKKVFESESSSVGVIIAKNILNKFFHFYRDLKDHAKYMDIYRNKFLLRGHKIKYVTDGKKETCKVLGVDPENCSLKVENPQKKVVLISTPTKVIIPKKIKKTIKN